MTKKLKIKLFADGADAKGMFEVYNQGIVRGFTTNPTLMRKAGIQNYEEFAKMVLKAIPDMPISFEVFADDVDNILKEAHKIASWGENVYVKIPITNTGGTSLAPLMQLLSDDGIKVNATAIFTSDQVANVVKNLSEDTPSIVSVFAGRIADTGRNPVETMRNSLPIVRTNKNCELLWASTREMYNLIQAEQCGCHIITVPNDILKKLSMLDKDLIELSLDTVKMFRQDSVDAGYNIL